MLLGQSLRREELTLETLAGPVPVRLRHRSERVSSGWMSQPIPTWGSFERAGELFAALGVGGSTLPVEMYVNGPRHVYVALEDEADVAALRVDAGALAQLGELCVSCFAGEGSRWKTRMFAPALGVAEDPATGSAAGPLAVHLARHRRIAFGRQIEIRQGAELGARRCFTRASRAPPSGSRRRGRRLGGDRRARAVPGRMSSRRAAG